LLVLGVEMAGSASTGGAPAHDFVLQRHARQSARLAELLIEASACGELGAMQTAEVSVRLTVMNGLETHWLIEPGLDVDSLLNDYLDALVMRWPASRTPAGSPDRDIARSIEPGVTAFARR
jgi:hypothetical protein